MSIKKTLTYSFSFTLIVIFAVFLLAQKNTGDTPYVLIDKTKINIEIADNAELRKKGLSGKEFLAKDTGMLFIFEEEGIYPFWMKDMSFPIDIMWIDKNYQIVDVTKNATPESYPQTFRALRPIKYVLEVSSGFIDLHKIDINKSMSLEL